MRKRMLRIIVTLLRDVARLQEYPVYVALENIRNLEAILWNILDRMFEDLDSKNGEVRHERSE